MRPAALVRIVLAALVLAVAPSSALAAVNDSRTIDEDNFPLVVDVLDNDDPPNPHVPNTSQIQSVTQPAHGTTSVNEDTYDQINYSANPDYCGPDSFTYSGDFGSATVSMDITCVDDPPLAVNDPATVDEDSGAVDYDVVANDTDVDAGPKLITAIVQPQFGMASLVGNKIRYAPPANFCGGDNVGYTLNNSIFLAQKAFLTVDVTCRPDLPVANDDSFTVGFNAGTTFLSVLANDSDADNLFNGAANPEDIPIIAVTQPLSGSTAIAQGASVNTDQIAYTPNRGFCGMDSFIYRVFRDEVPPARVVVTVPCPSVAGPGGGTAPRAKASAGKVKVQGTTLKVPLTCTTAASCTISLSLSIAQKVKASRTKTVVIGKAKVTLKPGQKRTVAVRLDKTGRRALKKSRRLKAKLTIILGAKTLTTRTVSFKAKPKG